jgi:hypothetical protein
MSDHVYPLPALVGDRLPKVSDGFHTAEDLQAGRARRIHPGADIMYPIKPGDPDYTGKGIVTDYYKLGAIRRTEGHIVPFDTPAIACVAGKVFKAKSNPRGHSVLIGAVGSEFAYYYQHLEKLMVSDGDEVKLGQPLGIVGANPNEKNAIVHLHFEIWHPDHSHPVNPKPVLRTWPKVFL